MKVINLPETTYPLGQQILGPFNLPVGTKYIGLRYTTPGWPDVSDGSAILQIFISRQGGPFDKVWEVEFQHKVSRRQGVIISPLSATMSLQNLAQAGDRAEVRINLSIAMTTAVSVEIN
jgi:hypothetical protein